MRRSGRRFCFPDAVLQKKKGTVSAAPYKLFALDQSSLLRALGNESRWKPNISGTEKLREGVDLLLCSDGFWEYITDQEILDDNVEPKSAVDWGEKMLKRVQSRFKPGNDNYSLITVKVK